MPSESEKSACPIAANTASLNVAHCSAGVTPANRREKSGTR